jgi:UDP-N-acetylmuramoyl-tripeptide--D-alanyl-D-alanine ligase
MNNLAGNEWLFFSRTLESFLANITSQLTVFLERYACGGENVPLQLLRCGAVLAYALKYVQNPEQCRKILLRLYGLVAKQKYENGAAVEDVRDYEISRMRFLLAYTQCDPAVTNDVQAITEKFLKQIEGAADFLLLRDSKPQRAYRTPNSLQYDYLMLLAELWRFMRDAEAYERLRQYCTLELQGAPYHEVCGRHRLIGIFAILPAPFKEMSGDILLQNLYRSNYLDTSLKNDPWRFMEQICLHQLLLPDETTFRFVTALFLKLIEEYNHSVRYARIDLVIDSNIPVLVNALLLYMRSCEENKYSAEHLLPDFGKSIWDTGSVLKITDGTLLPELSKPKRYSMGTYIFDQITPGTLFFSPDDNWHRVYRYGSKAYEKPFLLGAKAVMTNRHPEKITGAMQFLLVRNTFSAMLKLALENRKRYKGKVIGITGSVGKTTTASMVHDILSHFGRSYKNIARFNHQVGVPKSVANIPQESDYAVIEMGMGKPGTILPKSVMARPHIVIVTEIQHDHMEFHDSISSVITTKLEIVDGLEPGGVVVLNRDSRHFAHMLGVLHAQGIARIISFGEHPLADIRAICIQLYPDYSEIEVEIYGRHTRYKLSLPGVHMALNSLAVLAVLYELEVDFEKALLQFQTLLPVSGRNEIFEVSFEKGKTVQIIDDSFNANPASMRSSFHMLSLMKPKNKGRRIMVAGDMGELGEKTKEYHEALADDVNQSKIDIFYSVGEYSNYLNDRINDRVDHRHFSTSIELRNVLVAMLQDGDIVAFKGSARKGDVKGIVKYLKKIELSQSNP